MDMRCLECRLNDVSSLSPVPDHFSLFVICLHFFFFYYKQKYLAWESGERRDIPADNPAETPPVIGPKRKNLSVQKSQERL